MRKRQAFRPVDLEGLERREVLSHGMGPGFFSPPMFRHFARGGIPGGLGNMTTYSTSGATTNQSATSPGSTGTPSTASSTPTPQATTPTASPVPGNSSGGWSYGPGSTAPSGFNGFQGEMFGNPMRMAGPGPSTALGGQGWGSASSPMGGGEGMGSFHRGGRFGSKLGFLDSLTRGDKLGTDTVQQIKSAFDTFATNYTSGADATKDQAAWQALHTTLFGVLGGGHQSNALHDNVVLSKDAVTHIQQALTTFSQSYTGTDATKDAAAVQQLKLDILNSVGKVTLSPPDTPFTAADLKNDPRFNPPMPPVAVATTTPTTATAVNGGSTTTTGSTPTPGGTATG